MRLLVADDHPLFRRGLCGELAAQPGIEVEAEVGNGDDALAAIRQRKPDIAILDIQMPGLSGIEIARRLTAESSPTAVVVLSLHREESDLNAALEAGVRGYVVKEDAAAEVVHAVRAVARGEMYISPSLSGLLVKALRSPETTPSPVLTAREHDVLRLLAEGLRNKEIAARLSVTPKTVEGYRANLMDKLGIHSVAGLVMYAIKHRLVSLDR